MSIKSILVPLDGSESSFNVLDTALVVANRFNGRIYGIHVRPKTADLPFQLDYVSDKLKKNVVEESQKAGRETALAIRQRFLEFCEQNDIPVDQPASVEGVGAAWLEQEGDVTELLVQYARLSDVIAAARPSRTKGSMLRSPLGEKTEALLMRSGRPILLAPPDWSAHRVGHAAIAWNESLEASRALAVTMPWLRDMEKVSLIVSRKREKGLELVSDYLALHGVEAEIEILPHGNKAVGQAILDSCRKIGVEMLIVGGFSHARSRQLIFGGVTQHLLRNSDVITIMVH